METNILVPMDRHLAADIADWLEWRSQTCPDRSAAKRFSDYANDIRRRVEDGLVP